MRVIKTMNLHKKLIASAMTACFAFGGLAILQPFATTAQAQAYNAKQIVDEAKAKQQAGEQLDGYVGVVNPNASQEIRNAVAEINAARRSIYGAKASGTGQAVSVIAALSGEKLVARAPSGEKVKLADLQWHVK